MRATEAKAVLDVLLPLAPTGHVVDVEAFTGQARAALEWLPELVASGATFGDVVLLPANKGHDDDRWIVARKGCAA